MSDEIEHEASETFAPHKNLQVLVDDSDWKLRSDGNTVTGRIVPFMQPTTIVDRGERFREQFLPNCMTAMIQWATHKRGNFGFMTLTLDHDESLRGIIGRAKSVEQRDDGAWADFRLIGDDSDRAKARDLLEESHTGLSVMFDDIAPPRLLAGVRSRVQVFVRHVAATPFPAYTGAMVTGVREQIEPPSLDDILERPALAEWQSYLDSLTPTPTR